MTVKPIITKASNAGYGYTTARDIDEMANGFEARANLSAQEDEELRCIESLQAACVLRKAAGEIRRILNAA